MPNSDDVQMRSALAPPRAEESVGMARKAPHFQANLALQNLAMLMQLAATKQFCKPRNRIKAKPITTIVVGEEVQSVAQKCGGVGSQRHIDARALFERFATVSTLSSAVAPEHGNVNRFIRSGSNPMLDDLEAPTLDATGLRLMLRGVGLGVPNNMSVRPMLAEFGGVVGCQLRLTYAQFETLRAARKGCGEVAAAAKVQRAWRTWSTRCARRRELFERFATVSTLSSAVAPEHGNVNRFIRSGSNSMLDELEAPTLDATGLRHMLRGVGLGVPKSTSIRPMLAEYGEVVGCQPRLTYVQFETLRAALNGAPAAKIKTLRAALNTRDDGAAAAKVQRDDGAAAAKVQRAWRTWRMRSAGHRALFTRFATLSSTSTAVAPEHGKLNRLIRSGSPSKLVESEAPTLDATGLRHMLRGVGIGVPNNTSVRPMLVEFGEVVGCQPRLTYAQFETLYAALKAYSNVPAVAKIQSAWRKWRMRRMWPRALFVRFATQSTADLNRRNRSGSHPMLDELEVPTLDATGLRHVLRGVGLGVPNSTSVRPMIAEFGEVVGCQPRLTYAQFGTLRAALNDCGDGAAAVAKRRALVAAKVRAVGKATIAYEQRGWFECMPLCNEV